MKKDKKYILCILILASLYFIWIPNLYKGDDTLFHTSNIIANANNNFIISKIIPKMESNLGYGINIFYPPLPHYLGTIFYLITKNIETAMKLLQWLSIFLAGLTMYIYLDKITKNKEQAFLGAILYQSMPYLFTDVFTRGALNEGFLFFEVPLVFLSYYYLIENNYKKFYLYFVLGFSLLIYTHLVLTIYITIFSCIYLLIFHKKIWNKKSIKSLVLGTIITLGITSIFWINLLEHYLLGIYYIFSIQYKRGINFFTYPLSLYIFPKSILSSAHNPLRFYFNMISYPLIILVYLLPLKNKTIKNKRNFCAMILILILCFLFETTDIIWKIIPNILKNIQFPWRLSLITSFTIAVISSYGIECFHQKSRKIVIITSVILIIIINFYYSTSLPKKEKQKEYLLTTSTSNINSWEKEYLPLKSINDRYSLPTKEEVFKNKKEIKIIKNNGIDLSFKVISLEKKEKIELPRIYYLGYVLRKDSKKLNLTQSKSGLLETTIKEKGTYYLKYEGTINHKISRIISLLTLMFFIKYIIKK